MTSFLAPSQGVLLLQSFADVEECREILAVAEAKSIWKPAEVGHYQNDVLVASSADPSVTTAFVTQGFNYSFSVIDRIREAVRDQVTRYFGIRIQKFSPMGVSRYEMGSSVGRHRDTSTYSTHRLVTVILYLNHEFEGGRLIFPDLGIQHAPQEGDVMVFLSEHFHSVSPIVSGTRYCLIFFGEN